MTRLPRSRVAVATGLTLGSVATGLVLATTASAADLAPPSAPSTVVAGAPFIVTGTGCPSVHPEQPAFTVVLTDAATAVDDLVIGESDSAGTWSAVLSFPAGTTAGVHEVGAVCTSGPAGAHTETEYPIVAVTVTARPTGQAGAPQA